MEVLEKNGLQYFWDKTKDYVNENGAGITNITAGTSTSSGDYTLTPVTFERSNNDNITLNIPAKNGWNGVDGEGVPSGGVKGQILAKKSEVNNDTEWVDNDVILKSLSDINITTLTTLDAIVTAIPNGKTLQIYLTSEDATTLYGSTGGVGNIPVELAGLLTIEKRSENNFAFIKYQTDFSTGNPDNIADAGVYYCTKLDAYRDWMKANDITEIIESVNDVAIMYTDGRMECYGTINSTDVESSQWGPYYFKQKEIAFPTPFAEKPTVVANAYGNSGMYFCSLGSDASLMTTRFTVRLMSIQPIIATDFWFTYHAYGRWK